MTDRKLKAHDLVQPAVVGLQIRIRRAAQRVVQARSDAAAVHDFRVGLRRLRTVMRAARGLYGKKRVKALLSDLKAFGAATNALRDEEVLGETIEGAVLAEAHRAQVRAWLGRRSDRERKLRDAAIVFIAGTKLDEVLDDIEACVDHSAKGTQSASTFAKSRLKDVRDGVRDALPVTRSDAEALHRLRIRFKRLRYTAEMLGRFMTLADASKALQSEPPRARRPGPNYAAVARLAARMQKVLGLLHDADMALATVRADDDLAVDVREQLLVSLGVRRGQLADDAIQRLGELPPALFGRDAVR